MGSGYSLGKGHKAGVKKLGPQITNRSNVPHRHLFKDEDGGIKPQAVGRARIGKKLLVYMFNKDLKFLGSEHHEITGEPYLEGETWVIPLYGNKFAYYIKNGTRARFENINIAHPKVTMPSIYKDVNEPELIYQIWVLQDEHKRGRLIRTIDAYAGQQLVKVCFFMTNQIHNAQLPEPYNRILGISYFPEVRLVQELNITTHVLEEYNLYLETYEFN